MATLSAMLLAQLIGLAYTTDEWRKQTKPSERAQPRRRLVPRVPDRIYSAWFVGVLIGTALSFVFTTWAAVRAGGDGGHLSDWQQTVVGVTATMAMFALIAPPMLSHFNRLTWLLRPLVILVVVASVLGVFGAGVFYIWLNTSHAVASLIVTAIAVLVGSVGVGGNLDQIKQGTLATDLRHAVFWQGIFFFLLIEFGLFTKLLWERRLAAAFMGACAFAAILGLGAMEDMVDASRQELLAGGRAAAAADDRPAGPDG